MKRRKTKEKNNPIIDSKAFPNTVTYMPFRLSQSVMQSSSGHENALSSLSAFKMLQIILAQILIVSSCLYALTLVHNNVDNSFSLLS